MRNVDSHNTTGTDIDNIGDVYYFLHPIESEDNR